MGTRIVAERAGREREDVIVRAVLKRLPPVLEREDRGREDVKSAKVNGGEEEEGDNAGEPEREEGGE